MGLCVSNNPVKYVDPKGEDAIWLTYSKGAVRQQHTAIAVQDVSNNWWFMSFEARNGDMSDIMVFPYRLVQIAFNGDNTIRSANFLMPVEDKDTSDYMDLNGYFYRISCVYNYTDKQLTVLRTYDMYDDQAYLEGDYSRSLEKARHYAANPPKYDALSTNCAGLALDVLQASTTGDAYEKINDVLWAKSQIRGDTIIVKKPIIPKELKNKVKELFNQ